MLSLIDRLPLGLLLIAVMTLGLAPFVPEPHVWQKLNLLMAGGLHRPVDVIDLILHGAPWILLTAKIVRLAWLSAKR